MLLSSESKAVAMGDGMLGGGDQFVAWHGEIHPAEELSNDATFRLHQFQENVPG